jgi:hypothetical protein
VLLEEARIFAQHLIGQEATERRSRSVQQLALVRLRESQGLAHFARRQPIDIAQNQDLALPERQTLGLVARVPSRIVKLTQRTGTGDACRKQYVFACALEWLSWCRSARVADNTGVHWPFRWEPRSARGPDRRRVETDVASSLILLKYVGG